ncbi:VENN motif pre-toxin domain-containing protein, partial [Enterobacter asburiae]
SVSAGIAGGIAGGNTAGAAAGASAGKNSVENNYLSADQTTSWLEKYKSASTDEERKKLVDVASKANAAQQQKALNTQISKDYLVKQQDDLIQLMQSPGCDADCKQLAQYSINQLSPVIDNYDEMQRSNNIPKAAIATISLSIPILGRAVAPAVADLIGSSTLATRGVSAATSGIANATSQAYNIHNDPSEVFSPNSLITAMITGAATTGMKYVGTTAVSTAGAGISSLIDGKNPTAPMIGAAGGATLGYLFGLGVQKVDNKVWNPWSNGFKDYQNSRMPSIIEPPKVNQLPAIAGATAGGYLSERAGKAGEDYVKGKLK